MLPAARPGGAGVEEEAMRACNQARSSGRFHQPIRGLLTWLLVPFTVALCAAEARGRGGMDFIEVASSGRSEYVICIAEDAIASERTAARELQYHIKLVTGAELPIAVESAQHASRAFTWV